MAIARIDAGVCGFITTVHATGDRKNVRLEIETDCEHIKKMAAELPEINPMTEIYVKPEKNKVYNLANLYCSHPACPVPAGILKAIEVCIGFALPKNASIEFIKD